MAFTVFRSGSGSSLSDLTVALVFKRGQYADLLRQVFPTMIQARADGSAVYRVRAGDAAAPEFLEAVEIDSPTLNLALLGGALLVALLVLMLLRRR